MITVEGRGGGGGGGEEGLAGRMGGGGGVNGAAACMLCMQSPRMQNSTARGRQNVTLKWLSSLLILMQESFWW